MTCGCEKNTCGNPCSQGCKPARYSQGFKSGCDCPEETDTTLSIDYARATLNYKAERHTDIITGTQLGSIIALPDLRDVNIDYDFDAMCAEFIYHKYGECGDGCRSQEDAWSLFSIDQDGAKQDHIRYVRGANAYGCPVFLDVPSNVNEYWYAGWKTDGEHKEFGYYQAQPVDELPKDKDGNYIVISQDPNTKQPIVGSIPLDCILNNIMGNVGMNVWGSFSKVQETRNFWGTVNPINGNFDITWNDWNNLSATDHAGEGTITGHIDWTSKFDSKNGNMVYHITNVHFTEAHWIKDKGVTISQKPTLHLSGMTIPNGARTEILVVSNFGTASWSRNINRDFPCDYTITVAPGQTFPPINFAYIFVDWVGDDEGYLQVNFQNKLAGWEAC